MCDENDLRVMLHQLNLVLVANNLVLAFVEFLKLGMGRRTGEGNLEGVDRMTMAHWMGEWQLRRSGKDLEC